MKLVRSKRKYKNCLVNDAKFKLLTPEQAKTKNSAYIKILFGALHFFFITVRILYLKLWSILTRDHTGITRVF